MEFSLQILSRVKLYWYHTKSWLSRIRSVARCFVTCARVSTGEQVKARSITPLLFTPSRQDEMSPALSTGSKQQPTSRRSVHYPPNIWDYDFLESLASTQQKRANYHDVEKGLEENVKKLVQERQTEQLALLTLIDDIQRLGISHRFQEDIAQALNRLYLLKNRTEENGLNATALRFKLLRQHGFAVSADEEFGKFKDSEGKFMTSLHNDVHGLLNLYEASYYAFEGEFLLDEANAFAQKHLTKLKDVVKDRSLEDRIARTLDLPLHHRLPVVEAKHTLKTYNGNPSLREIAKLNFNTTQSMYQSELAAVIRWWRQLDLPNKLGFSRDRIVENFNAAVVMAPGPQDGDCRKAMAKLIAVLCVIDDIYDVYGSLEELKLFTLATERWDVNAIDELPEYMRLSFLAMFNSANEMAYEIMKKTGFNCLPYIKQGWCDLCKAFMTEAEWYFGKQMPTFEDYLEIGWRSVGGVILLRAAYFYSDMKFTLESLGHLENLHEAIRYSCILSRVINDWGTEEREQERGEAAKSINCYIHTTGAPVEDARKHMKSVIQENWKKFNKVAYGDSPPFSKAFLELIANFPRCCTPMYSRGDGLGTHDDKVISYLMEVLLQPAE
ncbi:Isoprene synthase, chloroplastic-like protein [Drosera capensis]